MKTTLSLNPHNGGAFNCMPAREIELEAEKILCNNVVLPWEFNPHTVRLYVIGHEFGALAAIWADCTQDALDELIDTDNGKAFLVENPTAEDEANDDLCRLGNAGELCDLTNAWIQTVRLDPAQDCKLLCAFAEARGANSDNLDR